MTVYAFPCVGGPLDGEHATSEDFGSYRARKCTGCGGKLLSYLSGGVCPSCGSPRPDPEPGMYAHLSREYHQYNSSGLGKAHASMVWVHQSISSRGKIPGSQR